MAVVNFDKAYIMKLLGTELDDKKLMSVGVDMGVDVKEINDNEIIIDLFQRPDMLDAVGFVRAMKYFMHKSAKYSYKVNGKSDIEVAVDAKTKRWRPFISGFVVKDITLDAQSVKHIMNFADKFSEVFGRGRKKVALGIHDLDKVRGKLQYAISKDADFKPLDAKENYTFKKILAEHEKGIKYGNIIKGEHYPVLKDEAGVMALIPIIHSDRTKVTTETHNIFVDITGTSEHYVKKAADVFASSFSDLGGNIYTVKTIYNNKEIETPSFERKEMKLSLRKIEEQIGVRIGFNNIISLANKMGYEAALLGSKIRFRIPPYRTDIISDRDIVEDIAIAYGFEYIQQIPVASTQEGGLEDTTKLMRSLSTLCIGMGFTEEMNSYLTNEDTNFIDMGLPLDLENAVTLKNSQSSSLTMMRTWLLPSLLKNLHSSLNETMPQKLFEIDMVFGTEKHLPAERYNLACTIADPKANFNEIKSTAEEIMQALGMEFSIKARKHPSFIEGRCAEILVNNASVGIFGEVHPKVLVSFGIEEPTLAFEMELFGTN